MQMMNLSLSLDFTVASGLVCWLLSATGGKSTIFECERKMICFFYRCRYLLRVNCKLLLMEEINHRLDGAKTLYIMG